MANREPDKSLRHAAARPPPRSGIGAAWLWISSTVAIVVALTLQLHAEFAADAQGRQFLSASRALLVLLACGVSLVGIGIYYAVTWNMRARRQRRAARPLRPAPPPSDRPFTDRLSQYLEEQPRPATRANPSQRRSPMAPFVAYLPGPRRGPKSPGTIRAILLRIRHLLRSGT